MAPKGKRGRYSVVSGCAWRNRKLQSVSRAARGLLLDIWSFVADQETYGELTAADVRALKRGNPNSSRQLKELVSVGLLQPNGTGYHVHDYREWNRFEMSLKAGLQTGVRRGRDESADKDANKGADKDAYKAGSVVSDTYDPSFKTQDPGPINSPTESSARESWRAVGGLYAKRYTAATGRPVALDLHRKWFEAIALESSGDPRLVAKSLDGFWADDWAAKNAWPVSAWAKQFGRHLDAGRQVSVPKPLPLHDGPGVAMDFGPGAKNA